MINSETNQQAEPIEYGINAEELQRQAEKNMLSCKEYKKMQKKLNELDIRTDFAKISHLKTKMKLMVHAEIDRLWMLEMEQRKSVRGINQLLRKKDRTQFSHWQELIAGISFLMDMLDFTINDLNELLLKNNVGIKMENFKEIAEARKVAQKLTGDNLKHSNEWHRQMWMEESDRLYEHLKQRCSTYRRKVERMEEKQEKKQN